MADGHLIPIRNGMLTPEHFTRIGSSIWIYLLLLDKITAEYQDNSGEVRGRVLGGAVITAEQLSEPFGVTPQTARNHVNMLKRAGYITVRQTRNGWQIEVRNSRKWPHRFSLPDASPPSDSAQDTAQDSKSLRVENSCDPSTVQSFNSSTVQSPIQDNADPEDIAEDIASSEEEAPVREAAGNWLQEYQRRFVVAPGSTYIAQIGKLQRAHGLTDELIMTVLARAHENRRRNVCAWAITILSQVGAHGVRTAAQWEAFEAQPETAPPVRAGPKRSNVFLQRSKSGKSYDHVYKRFDD